MLDGVGAGVLFISPSGDKLWYALQLHFLATNNVTKYEELCDVNSLLVDVDYSWQWEHKFHHRRWLSSLKALAVLVVVVTLQGTMDMVAMHLFKLCLMVFHYFKC